MQAVVPPDGFTEFVTASSAGLLRAAWLLTGDAGKAEDLLQTVLARLWRRWQRVEAGGNPEAYTRRMLYTTYLSWRRRRWRFEVPAAQLPEEAHHGDIAASSAARDAVRRALGRLSPQQRAVLVLRYLEDRSIADTADTLGCSVATVKVQAHRALNVLRRDPSLQLMHLDEVGP